MTYDDYILEAMDGLEKKKSFNRDHGTSLEEIVQFIKTHHVERQEPIMRWTKAAVDKAVKSHLIYEIPNPQRFKRTTPELQSNPVPQVVNPDPVPQVVNQAAAPSCRSCNELKLRVEKLEKTLRMLELEQKFEKL